MTERRNRPSKWWFWGVPAVANLYLAFYVVMLYMLVVSRPAFLRHMSVEVQNLWVDVVFALLLPGKFFITGLVLPVLGIAEADLENVNGPALPGFIAGCLIMWELGAVLVGLVTYGCACVIHVLASGDGARKDGGRGKGDE